MVLPSDVWPDGRLQRAVARVGEMMGKALTLAAREPDQYARLDQKVGTLNCEEAAKFDAVVAAPEELDQLPSEQIERLYRMTPDGLVERVGGTLDEVDFPGVDDLRGYSPSSSYSVVMSIALFRVR